ncbi:DUF2281 domain-containing protein [Phormidium sp. CLA17]|uniref:DUF2281 domain-containing protein n=1 Tax=Leptolyngbya sp. Cla-17 TaxID=2803751 RepID=UPI001492D08E|nr:DUF2281 domain-containing protein [Leptolyngbya sp. Cla-17]MBM0743195.1 DUF2281 domain-containing protein [Leptolyngbya sp. Cla-17]
MTIKEQLIQELEQLPEAQLEAVLALVRSLKAKPDQDSDHNSRVWQAYLASEQQYEEVYRRLANS